MASYIAIFISLVCLILLVILLIRFKKLFSTDAIIEKTRNQMNKMITDINNNAKRDIELINDSSRRVRALLADCDQKMEQFKLATERLREMIAIAEKMENKSSVTYYNENKNVSNIKPVGQNKSEIIANTYKVEKKSSNNSYKNYSNIQNSLFDEESVSTNLAKNIPVENRNYIQKNNNIQQFFDEKPVINKSEKDAKKLNENIKKLFNQGMQVEDIAKELSCSIAEVEFIIDML